MEYGTADQDIYSRMEPIIPSLHSPMRQNAVIAAEGKVSLKSLQQLYIDCCLQHGVRKPSKVILSLLPEEANFFEVTEFRLDNEDQVVYLGNKGTFVLLRTLTSHCAPYLTVLSLAGVGLMSHTYTEKNEEYFKCCMELLLELKCLRLLDLSDNPLENPRSDARRNKGEENNSQVGRKDQKMIASDISGSVSAVPIYIVRIVQQIRSLHYLILEKTNMSALFISKINRILEERRKGFSSSSNEAQSDAASVTRIDNARYMDNQDHFENREESQNERHKKDIVEKRLCYSDEPPDNYNPNEDRMSNVAPICYKTVNTNRMAPVRPNSCSSKLGDPSAVRENTSQSISKLRYSTSKNTSHITHSYLSNGDEKETISYLTKIPPIAQTIPLIGYSLLGKSASVMAQPYRSRDLNANDSGIPSEVTGTSSIISAEEETCEKVAKWIKQRLHNEKDSRLSNSTTHETVSLDPLVQTIDEESSNSTLMDEKESTPLPHWVIHSLVELRRRLVRNKHNLQRVFDLFVLPEEEEENIKYADGAFDAFTKLPDYLTPVGQEGGNFAKNIVGLEKKQGSCLVKGRTEEWNAERLERRRTGKCSWRSFFRGLRLLNIRYASKDLKKSTEFASMLGLLYSDYVCFGVLLWILRPMAGARLQNIVLSPDKISEFNLDNGNKGQNGTSDGNDNSPAADVSPKFRGSHSRVHSFLRNSAMVESYASRFTVYGPDLVVSADGNSPQISMDLFNASQGRSDVVNTDSLGNTVVISQTHSRTPSVTSFNATSTRLNKLLGLDATGTVSRNNSITGAAPSRDGSLPPVAPRRASIPSKGSQTGSHPTAKVAVNERAAIVLQEDFFEKKKKSGDDEVTQRVAEQIVWNALYDFRHEIRSDLRRVGLSIYTEVEASCKDEFELLQEDELESEPHNSSFHDDNEDEEEIFQTANCKWLSSEGKQINEVTPVRGLMEKRASKDPQKKTTENVVTMISYVQLTHICCKFIREKDALARVLASCGIHYIPSRSEEMSIDYESRLLRKLGVNHLAESSNEVNNKNNDLNQKYCTSLVMLKLLPRSPSTGSTDCTSLDRLVAQTERDLWKCVSARSLQQFLQKQKQLAFVD